MQVLNNLKMKKSLIIPTFPFNVPRIFAKIVKNFEANKDNLASICFPKKYFLARNEQAQFNSVLRSFVSIFGLLNRKFLASFRSLFLFVPINIQAKAGV